jgi:threonine dehydratase
VVPDLADVLAARQRIAPYMQPTALYRYPALDAVTGACTRVKHENHQPVGAFKVRGVNLVGQLTRTSGDGGVIAASTGNHGQSVAYAADLFGVRAVICMPELANPVKVESMRALGAEVVFVGRDFDEGPRVPRGAGGRPRVPPRPLRERAGPVSSVIPLCAWR